MNTLLRFEWFLLMVAAGLLVLVALNANGTVDADVIGFVQDYFSES